MQGAGAGKALRPLTLSRPAVPVFRHQIHNIAKCLTLSPSSSPKVFLFKQKHAHQVQQSLYLSLSSNSNVNSNTTPIPSQRELANPQSLDKTQANAHPPSNGSVTATTASKDSKLFPSSAALLDIDNDNDLSSSYKGASSQSFSDEAVKILLESVPAKDVEIKPGLSFFSRSRT
jgi:hypothetical protein